MKTIIISPFLKFPIELPKENYDGGFILRVPCAHLKNFDMLARLVMVDQKNDSSVKSDTSMKLSRVSCNFTSKPEVHVTIQLSRESFDQGFILRVPCKDVESFDITVRLVMDAEKLAKSHNEGREECIVSL